MNDLPPQGQAGEGQEPEMDIDAHLEQVRHPDLGEALRAALAPTEDSQRRARAKVDRRLQGRSLTSSLSDIAGTGMATVMHLLTNPHHPADRDEEVNHD